MVDDADFFGSVSPEVRAVDEHYGFREVRSEKCEVRSWKLEGLVGRRACSEGVGEGS